MSQSKKKSFRDYATYLSCQIISTQKILLNEEELEKIAKLDVAKKICHIPLNSRNLECLKQPKKKKKN